MLKDKLVGVIKIQGISRHFEQRGIWYKQVGRCSLTIEGAGSMNSRSGRQEWLPEHWRSSFPGKPLPLFRSGNWGLWRPPPEVSSSGAHSRSYDTGIRKSLLPPLKCVLTSVKTGIWTWLLPRSELPLDPHEARGWRLGAAVGSRGASISACQSASVCNSQQQGLLPPLLFPDHLRVHQIPIQSPSCQRFWGGSF